ncbi:MAG: hypothetical protein AAGB19_14910 [Cyanobacteria bacterium P01_F01_bin.3]
MPDTIHQVLTLDEQPTLTFQLYSDTQPRSRYEFQPEKALAKPF